MSGVAAVVMRPRFDRAELGLSARSGREHCSNAGGLSAVRQIHYTLRLPVCPEPPALRIQAAQPPAATYTQVASLS